VVASLRAFLILLGLLSLSRLFADPEICEGEAQHDLGCLYIENMYNGAMRFEWHESKNRANVRKHGVSFEEAQTVFYDPLTKVAADPDHSDEEDRFIAVGYSSQGRQLLIVHLYRERAHTIRIISARRLTRTEKKQYEEIV
jgi:uncharacterized DUF497 family protein